MGRTAYVGMAAHWPPSNEVLAGPMNEIPKVVFSRTLKEADWAGSRVADGDLATEVARLTQPGKEYRLLVYPVVLGSGLPMFAARQPSAAVPRPRRSSCPCQGVQGS